MAGGAAVSAFAVLSDFLKPKNFTGILAAALAVALVSLGLEVLARGHAYAAVEARSMTPQAPLLAALALAAFALLAWHVLPRHSTSAALIGATLIWAGLALGAWVVFQSIKQARPSRKGKT